MIRDRITSLRRVKASDLIPNPKNWRQHPPAQQAALRELIEQIGYAEALVARETPDGLMLIDGHLRAETTPDTKVPVLVLDITEAEADVLLATLDPIASMARADQDALVDLLDGLEAGGEATAAMLEALANGSYEALKPLQPLYEQTDPEAEWEGMPEFEQEDQSSWKQLIVHFRNETDMIAFSALLNQSITERTQSLWYPAADIVSYEDKRFRRDNVES